MTVYDPTTPAAERRVHVGAYVLFFAGVLNLVLIGVLARLQPDLIARHDLWLGIGFFEGLIYLMLGSLVHQKHSLAALIVGIVLMIADGAAAVWSAAAAETFSAGFVTELAIRLVLIALLVQAMPATQEAPEHT